MRDEKEDLKLAQGARIVLRQRWRTVLRFHFKQQAHINVLEAVAVVAAVRYVLMLGLHGVRVTIFTDSGVVKGAGTKGRSSSRALAYCLRQLCAEMLAHDLYI